MKTSAPSQLCFIISLVLFILGILGGFGLVGAIAAYGTYLLVAAWVVLALGCLMKGF